MPTRNEIIARARSWLGTPYLHQASVKGAGTDCLGFVRGLYRELYDFEPEKTPAYSADWAEVSHEETLRDAARRHLMPVAIDKARLGDVVLFRVNAGAPAKHAALLVAPRRIIHAYSGRAVCESHLSSWWLKRLIYAFQFPGVED